MAPTPFLFLLPLFSGCEQLISEGDRQNFLCTNKQTSGLYVAFDWQQADVQMSPPLMTVYFYAIDQKAPYKFFLSGKEGGKVKLPAGTYNVLCYNDDVNELYVDEEEGFYGVLGYTRNLGTESELDTPIKIGQEGEDSDQEEDGSNEEEEPIIASSGKLLVANLYTLQVEEETEETQTIVLQPHISTCHYTCTFREVINKASLISIRCAVTGMARGVQLFDRQPIEEASEMLFPMDFYGDSLRGETEVFGALEMKHSLHVTMQLSDGTYHRQTFDVTEQVNEAPNPQIVEIVIDQLEVPDTGTTSTGGAFLPGVGDWTDWVIEVDMRK